MYTVVQSNAQQHSVQYTITRGTVAAMEKSIRNSKAWNEASGAEQGRAGHKERKRERRWKQSKQQKTEEEGTGGRRGKPRPTE